MLCNHVSRYHVAANAIRGGALVNPQVSVDAHEKASYCLHLAEKARQYILENGKGACRRLVSFKIVMLIILWNQTMTISTIRQSSKCTSNVVPSAVIVQCVLPVRVSLDL